MRIARESLQTLHEAEKRRLQERQELEVLALAGDLVTNSSITLASASAEAPRVRALVRKDFPFEPEEGGGGGLAGPTWSTAWLEAKGRVDRISRPRNPPSHVPDGGPPPTDAGEMHSSAYAYLAVAALDAGADESPDAGGISVGPSRSSSAGGDPLGGVCAWASRHGVLWGASGAAAHLRHSVPVSQLPPNATGESVHPVFFSRMHYPRKGSDASEVAALGRMRPMLASTGPSGGVSWLGSRSVFDRLKGLAGPRKEASAPPQGRLAPTRRPSHRATLLDLYKGQLGFGVALPQRYNIDGAAGAGVGGSLPHLKILAATKDALVDLFPASPEASDAEASTASRRAAFDRSAVAVLFDVAAQIGNTAVGVLSCGDQEADARCCVTGCRGDVVTLCVVAVGAARVQPGRLHPLRVVTRTYHFPVHADVAALLLAAHVVRACLEAHHLCNVAEGASSEALPAALDPRQAATLAAAATALSSLLPMSVELRRAAAGGLA